MEGEKKRRNRQIIYNKRRNAAVAAAYQDLPRKFACGNTCERLVRTSDDCFPEEPDAAPLNHHPYLTYPGGQKGSFLCLTPKRHPHALPTRTAGFSIYLSGLLLPGARVVPNCQNSRLTHSEVTLQPAACEMRSSTGQQRRRRRRRATPFPLPSLFLIFSEPI